MKTIIIPSDFSLESLACIPNLPSYFQYDRLNILLVHVFCLTDSISDLMLLSRREKDYQYISSEFRRRCQELSQQYEASICSIEPKCFYGSTVAIFRNFLEGHGIDLIVYPEHYQFRKLSKESLDPAKLIARCGCKVLIIGTKTQTRAEEIGLLMPEVHDLYTPSLK